MPALLWIATLALALSWFALLTAIAARSVSRLAAGVLVVTTWLVPLAAGCLVAMLWLACFVPLFALSSAVASSIKCFGSQITAVISLLLAYLLGAVLITLAARRRAAARWRLGYLVVPFLIAIGLWAYIAHSLNQASLAYLAALRVDAVATMRKVAPPVPDDRNAARIYEKALAGLDEVALGRLVLDRTDPDYNHEAALAALKANAHRLALLRQADALPACRFQRDYDHPNIQVLLPELTPLRAAGQLLLFNACEQARQGNIDAALADLRTQVRMTRHLAADPFLVSALVSFGMHHSAVDALQEILPAVTTPASLAQVQFNPAWPVDAFRRALQGESALFNGTLADLASGRSPTVPTRTGPSLFRIFLLPREIEAYRQNTARFEQVASRPYIEMRDQNRDIDLTGRSFLAAMLQPALAAAYDRATRAVAGEALAQTAVALTRYRLANGHYPDTLDALVPAFLDRLPLDPFDGKSLKLARDGDALRIYSIGPDGTDDGGKPIPDNKDKGDLVFRLSRVSR